MSQGEGGGAPTKCTPDVCFLYLDAIAFGLSYQSACAEAGITDTTLANWRERGKTGEEPYAKFFADEKKALAAWERDRIQGLDAAGPLWTREAWKLERRMPDSYSKRERHEHTGAEGGPIDIDHGGDAIDAIRSAITRLATRGTEGADTPEPDA